MTHASQARHVAHDLNRGQVRTITLVPRPCCCGSAKPRRELRDGAGRLLTFACDACESDKRRLYGLERAAPEAEVRL
jgi:hypothetical protein